MDTHQLKETIHPFFWVEHDDSFSVCLEAGAYKSEIFETRAEEGFEGNGYDWVSLALIFLQEQKPELKSLVKFDPEAGMFCAYASDAGALQDFILSFKTACEDETLIQNLFSRAELD